MKLSERDPSQEPVIVGSPRSVQVASGRSKVETFSEGGRTRDRTESGSKKRSGSKKGTDWGGPGSREPAKQSEIGCVVSNKPVTMRKR